ncbi:PREDICTED: RING finger protein 24-like [Amphimedon queenslandica]|uniref:RING-type domain-containing protein n=1 Tax=Amphimedon queenslandica TaxID=400682 RepID=A0A1X7VPM1_AMPQE|nr:PREDICTED: RING finger protein 24-like [Amphimedon queenslandica]|eukprot:XP_019859596.1 PREDICTED: RING finger protein 24-like [Amphimedon queenslandica]
MADRDSESPILAYVLATGTLLAAACLMCLCLMCCAKCPEWRERRRLKQEKESLLKNCNKVKYSISEGARQSNLCDSCAVCLEDFLDREIIVLCPCRHAYHKKCLCDWLSQSPSCPICKEGVSLNASTEKTPLLA